MALATKQPSTSDPWSIFYLNRALSIRSGKHSTAQPSTASANTHSRRGFSFTSLRGSIQPELSRRLFRLIKSQNSLISAHDSAARERASIASQLSEWGEQTADPGVVDLSDKIGVMLAELAELDEAYAQRLDDARGHLKAIRNTEKSVQPSRDARGKIADEIGRLKIKEPESTKLLTLEQELVRAEAENLVAEAQLSNITRRKLKDAYTSEFTATIERAEKQIILAKHGRRLLGLLDDAPVAPGDDRPVWQHASQARQILNDAEDDLREWRAGDDSFTGQKHGELDDDEDLARYVTATTSTPANSAGRRTPALSAAATSSPTSPSEASVNAAWNKAHPQNQGQIQESAFKETVAV